MTSALIGHTGFVGSHLARRQGFDLKINRSNLEALRGRELDYVVCAGLPAAKWIANRDPAADRANMQRLRDVLATLHVDRFVLISTVDVYPQTEGCDESVDPTGLPNHAYGTHRLEFEHAVRARFPQACVLRLPALFGTGLRKNVIFDLLHRNQLEVINPASRFQWYPLERLAGDIGSALGAGLALANLVTPPIATATILQRFFPDRSVGASPAPIASYDLHTRHARTFGGAGRYITDAETVLEALGRFVREAGVVP